MPPDRTLPPPPPDFAGVDAPYLGYFPPVVDGTLVALVTTSRPDDPERTAMSVGALAEQRLREQLRTVDVSLDAVSEQPQGPEAETLSESNGEVPLTGFGIPPPLAH